MTKATMLISVGLAAGLAMADGMSIADARKQVADCVSNPSTMTAVVKQLPAADQCAYLGDVVAAVAKMPGSQEEVAAACVNVSRAALKGASKDNVANMMAEIYATVPVEYLPAVSESLASDVVNRAADPSKTYTDDEYIAISTNTMAVINKRVESADAADVRSAFAALMFIRGSNNASEKVVSEMVASLPESAREPAKEWIAAVINDGDNGPLLVAGGVEGKLTPEKENRIRTVVQRVPIRTSGAMGYVIQAGDQNGGGNGNVSDSVNDPTQQEIPTPTGEVFTNNSLYKDQTTK